MTIEAKTREFEREMREGHLAAAERLAVELAPYYEAMADAEDRNPKAHSPSWGTEQ